MGTSSILAGTLLAAIGIAIGRPYDTTSVAHAVLKLEQMLTTGGGWQDQVGGLLPGCKITRSDARLPLQIKPKIVRMPSSFVNVLNRHMLLAFTGRPRLARNLLQSVVRRWYARLPEIVSTADALTRNAEQCAAAFERGDIATVGRCLSAYWEQKKCMASGAEPPFITSVMRLLRPHCHGISLTGAGGGGYLAMITKCPDQGRVFEKIVDESLRSVVVGGLTFHSAFVDVDGMKVSLKKDDAKCSSISSCIFDLDGTLIDYESASHEALEASLADAGVKSISWDVHAKIVGRRAAGSDGWAAIILAHYGVDAATMSIDDYIAAYRSEMQKRFSSLKALPGAIRLLRFLKSQNVPIAIATSSSRGSFEKKMKFHPDIIANVDVVVCGDDPQVEHGKPSPDIFLVAAQRLGIPPNEISSCLVFEDSPFGVMGAKSAGMLVAAIPDPRIAALHSGTFRRSDWCLKTLEDFDTSSHQQQQQQQGSAECQMSMMATAPEPLFSVKPSSIRIVPFDTKKVESESIDTSLQISSEVSSNVLGLREMLPYLSTHRGVTIVVHIPVKLTLSSNLSRFVGDLVLLHTLGIRLVLVLDCEHRVQELLEENNVPFRFHNGTRVVDEAGMKWDMIAAQEARAAVERELSKTFMTKGNVKSPSRVQFVSGNFVSLQQSGLQDGIDLELSGTVRSVDRKRISKTLEDGDIVILGHVAHSTQGVTRFCDSISLASQCATKIRADKLVYLTDGESLENRDNGEKIDLQLQTAYKFISHVEESLKSSFDHSLLIEYIRCASEACRQGVQRAHLINRHIDGALLVELFSRDGIGILISRDVYEGVRRAQRHDVQAIKELIRPLEAKDVLVPRQISYLENHSNEFVVVERDGHVLACAQCILYEDENMAEIACVAVDPKFRDGGQANALISYIKRELISMKIRKTFILTTKTYDWFIERGFSPCAVDDLPQSRQETYDFSRRPKILIQDLVDARQIIEEELLLSNRESRGFYHEPKNWA
eukprot:g3389.t1